MSAEEATRPEPVSCPFCGAGNPITTHGRRVVCVDCGAMGPEIDPRKQRSGGSLRNAMVIAWNRRGETAARERTDAIVARLREAFCTVAADFIAREFGSAPKETP